VYSRSYTILEISNLNKICRVISDFKCRQRVIFIVSSVCDRHCQFLREKIASSCDIVWIVLILLERVQQIRFSIHCV